METELVWFRNDGGPLCVVPRHPPPLWEGSDPPSAGRLVEATDRLSGTDVATDYDRACDCEGPTMLRAGESWVLVLPLAEDAAAWLPDAGDGHACLVYCFGRPQDASSEALLRLRDAQPDHAWRVIAAELPISPGGLVLMHAACRLETAEEKPMDASPPPRFVGIGDSLSCQLPAGTYLVSAVGLEWPEEYADATFVNFERTA